MHRMVYPFLAVISRGLGVSLTAMSMAMTARAAIGALAPLLATVADQRGRRTGMLLGMSVFSLGLGLLALFPGFGTFLLALIAAMVGKVIFDASMQAYLGDRIPYKRRGLIMAITEINWSLSFIIGVPAMAYLISRQSWQAPFPVLCGLGFIAIAALTWILPADPAPSPGQPNLIANLRSIIKYPAAVAALAVGFCFSASNELVNLIFGVWMEDAFGLKVTALGVAAAVIGLSELGGETLSGGFVDRLGKIRAVWLGITANSLAAIILPAISSSLGGAFLGLALFFISFEFTLVCSIPLMSEIMPYARATLLAANITGISLGRGLADLLGPPLYNLSSRVTGEPNMVFNCLVAVLFNLGALLALRRLQQNLGSEHELRKG